MYFCMVIDKFHHFNIGILKENLFDGSWYKTCIEQPGDENTIWNLPLKKVLKVKYLSALNN